MSSDKAPREWQPIESAPKGRTVLVHYKNTLGKGRTMRACYYPLDTLESDTEESGWANEGWYEESEAYEYLMALEGDPTHWMPLPPPPDAAPAAPQEQWTTGDMAYRPGGLSMVQAEPVAWGWRGADGQIRDCIAPDTHAEQEGEYTVPLYAHPAPAQAEPEGDPVCWLYLDERGFPKVLQTEPPPEFAFPVYRKATAQAEPPAAALDALDDLEAAARGDEPFPWGAADLIRSALSACFCEGKP